MKASRGQHCPDLAATARPVGPTGSGLWRRLTCFQTSTGVGGMKFLADCWTEGLSVWSEAALSPLLSGSPQHGSLQHSSFLPQSQLGGASVHKMGVTISCSLIIFAPFCYLEASYLVQPTLTELGLHKSVDTGGGLLGAILDSGDHAYWPIKNLPRCQSLLLPVQRRICYGPLPLCAVSVLSLSKWD